ncbi:hypothetical protein ThrDRAFT_03381 [Frankia casuarinae]|jgi:hypothetical protein|uniref:Uncharacterized protein n=1 Tax=Frankia casuarinae (strain DSM 45818 / CECT 9043 / HFP020203 / CcI3) TaxID=106370 RepID=Q2J9U6_FRACC|nr:MULTISPECIES: hypothetical protein [Frankia]ABD11946.1 hypothetical protein Francci3_2584 [Frankia casuarinae]ETA00201.1 hypothetical protein CcI6DRAFT_04392 [Frankia sp. CcI6]EYT90977.1 hypothetical protein ThrDRAFT_03381 [Frankia casuarinae]KDA41554.1 hypothetical protein BMG523Draft_03622 [Frankia sp. BMG5.23]KEZ34981.1 hypothetical protein CEDDRAFT_03658 [Frankia sp. CeD]
MATREQGIRRVGPVTAGLAAVAAAGAIGFGVLAHEHSASAATWSSTTDDSSVTSGNGSTSSSTSDSASSSGGWSGGTTVGSADGPTHASTGGS